MSVAYILFFFQILIHTQDYAFRTRIGTSITMQFESMKTNNEIPIHGFRFDIDSLRSGFVQSLVIKIVFMVLLLLLLVNLVIGFAVTRYDCQSLKLSFPISIMAICVFGFILHQHSSVVFRLYSQFA